MDTHCNARVATADHEDALPAPVREANARFGEHFNACGYCNETELDKHVKQCACCIRLEHEGDRRFKRCGFGEILGQWCPEGQYLELELRRLEEKYGIDGG